MTGPIPLVRSRVAAVDRRWRDQPLRTRLTAAAAGAATLTIIAVIAVAYLAVRHELLGTIDSQLRRQVSEVKTSTQIVFGQPPKLHVQSGVGDIGGFAQVIGLDGTPHPALRITLSQPISRSRCLTGSETLCASPSSGVFACGTRNPTCEHDTSKTLPAPAI